MKTILFVPSNENHVKIFWSINKHLGHYRTLFISQGSLKQEGAEEAMNQLGIKYVKLQSYGNPTTVMRQENVGVVVIANDIDVIPQWFVRCARKTGIPSVLIQDGILFDYNTVDNSLRKLGSNFRLMLTAFKLKLTGNYRKVTYGGSGCTQIHVWGTTAQSYLIRKGVDKSRIIIIGGITINKITNIASNKEKVILYAPTDLVHSGITRKNVGSEIIEAVCSTVLSFDEIRLVIKPHPQEDRQVYDRLLQKNGNSHMRIADISESVYDLISSSSSVITDISTIAAEALTTKKPVIIYLPQIEKIVPTPDLFPRDIISKKAALYAENDQMLHSHIAALLQGTINISEEMMAVIAESYFGPTNSDPSKTSAQAILSLVEKAQEK